MVSRLTACIIATTCRGPGPAYSISPIRDRDILGLEEIDKAESALAVKEAELEAWHLFDEPLHQCRDVDLRACGTATS